MWFMWLIMKYGPRYFFCNLEGQFKFGCTQFCDAVADAKHPHHQEALSRVKVSQARLMNEAEFCKKEVSQGTFTTKKVKTLPDDAIASNIEAVPANAIKADYGLAARTALQKVQQDLAMKNVLSVLRCNSRRNASSPRRGAFTSKGQSSTPNERN